MEEMEKLRMQHEIKESYDILIIEDDTDTNNLVKEAMTKAGYKCMQAFSGTEGLLYVSEFEINLVIMDLMLPGMNGEELIKKVKEVSGVPVIITSAKDSLDGKIELLESGAEDYITKPFEIRELVARAMVQLRKKGNNKDNTENMTYGDISLFPDGYSMSVCGQKITLTRQEYRIMELLLTSPERVFTKQTIYEYAWDEIYIGEDKTVNVHISNIRKKIKDVSNREYIETVWGIGFKMQE